MMPAITLKIRLRKDGEVDLRYKGGKTKPKKNHPWFHSPIGKAIKENPEGYIPKSYPHLRKNPH